MSTTVEEKLGEIKTTLESNLDAKAKKAAEDQIKQLGAELKDGLQKENTELKERLGKMEEDAKKNQKALDDLLTKAKNIPNTPVFKGAAQQMGEKLNEKAEALKKYKEGNGKGFTIEIDTKAVGTMASATSLTGNYFVSPQVVPGVIAQPYEEVHMRNLLPVGATDSNVIRYVRDNGGEGGPGMVAEGATKPQIDRDLAIIDSNVRKIATYFRIPEEMIDDIPYLQSFLTQIGLEELMSVEDAQIIYGDGTGQNLSGLYTNGTAFDSAASAVTSANRFDALRAARKQIRLQKLGGPLVAVVSPDDYFIMTSTKDTTNNYLFLGGGNGIALANPGTTNGDLNIGGIRVVEHTEMNTGEFLVFQPRAAAIFDRTGTSVRLYDQDQDNAIKNLITIVIEKRLALAIYRPLGIVKGTFAAAIADLAAADS